jgi:hypothetical protein
MDGWMDGWMYVCMDESLFDDNGKKFELCEFFKHMDDLICDTWMDEIGKHCYYK